MIIRMQQSNDLGSWHVMSSISNQGGLAVSWWRTITSVVPKQQNQHPPNNCSGTERTEGMRDREANSRIKLSTRLTSNYRQNLKMTYEKDAKNLDSFRNSGWLNEGLIIHTLRSWSKAFRTRDIGILGHLQSYAWVARFVSGSPDLPMVFCITASVQWQN